MPSINYLSYQLFVDLDGVLVDFDNAVFRLTGKMPDELLPNQMWPVLARTRRFYENLNWMRDGRLLWDSLIRFNPVILTGLPMGKWAEPQKRNWCERELGPDVPVIAGMSRRKGELAHTWMAEQGMDGRVPVLIDDRLKMKASWEDLGGIFILHLNAADSLSALANLGFPIEDASH